MKICIPIRERTAKKALLQVRRAKKYLKKGDLIEIWFDEILGEDMAGLIRAAGQFPVVVVCRGASEKGRFKGTEKMRIALLEEAVKRGAKIVDVGFGTAPSLIHGLRTVCRKMGARMLISYHCWDSTPSLEKMKSMIGRAQKLGADIVKIAAFVKNYSDNVLLFELTQQMASAKQNVVIVGMGPKGKISRIGCPLLGSLFTYVALDAKSATASGQWTVGEIKGLRE